MILLSRITSFVKIGLTCLANQVGLTSCNSLLSNIFIYYFTIWRRHYYSLFDMWHTIFAAPFFLHLMLAWWVLMGSWQITTLWHSHWLSPGALIFSWTSCCYFWSSLLAPIHAAHLWLSVSFFLMTCMELIRIITFLSAIVAGHFSIGAVIFLLGISWWCHS